MHCVKILRECVIFRNRTQATCVFRVLYYLLFMNSATNYRTYPVAGAAYGKLASIKDALTHAYDSAADKVLCGKVRPSSICDDDCLATDDAPTCPICAKRMVKLAAK